MITQLSTNKMDWLSNVYSLKTPQESRRDHQLEVKLWKVNVLIDQTEPNRDRLEPRKKLPKTEEKQGKGWI